MAWYQAAFSAKAFLKHGALFSATKWGATRAMATLLLKFTAGRVAVGAAATGATAWSVRRQIDAKNNWDQEVLASGDELFWVNAALQPIWAHLDAGLRRLIQDELEPALQRKLGYFGKYLYFTQLTLGEVAPRLGPVTVTRSAGAVDLNIGFEYSGDLAVAFSASLASIELADLRIKGSLQVSLRPLVESLNPIGGITISCLDRPSIELSLRTGSDLVPNLYDLVRSTVDDVVAGLLVVPNGVAVPIPTLGPETDGPSLSCPVPKGILRVTLQEIAGTAAAPVSSPYAVLRIGAADWRSPVAQPRSGGGLWATEADIQVWAKGNTQDFVVFSPNQSVDLRIFQSDVSLDLDVLLGSVRLPVQEIAHGTEVEVPLVLPDGSDSGRRLHFKGDFLAIGADSTPVQVPATTVVSAVQPKRGTHSRCSSKGIHAAATTAGAGDVEMFASVRVDAVEGLPADPTLKYSVRLSTGGGLVGESPPGRAPSLGVDQVSNEVMLQFARKLSPLLALADLADALGVSPDIAREFAEHHAAAGASAASAGGHKKCEEWDLEWCRRARQQAQSLAASSNPQFGRIFHLPVPPSAQVELELLRHGPGSAREEVVAMLVYDLGSIKNDASCDGPFVLALSEGGTCTLQGSLRMRPLHLQGMHLAEPSDALHK